MPSEWFYSDGIFFYKNPIKLLHTNFHKPNGSSHVRRPRVAEAFTAFVAASV